MILTISRFAGVEVFDFDVWIGFACVLRQVMISCTSKGSMDGPLTSVCFLNLPDDTGDSVIASILPLVYL